MTSKDGKKIGQNFYHGLTKTITFDLVIFKRKSFCFLENSVKHEALHTISTSISIRY